MANNTLGKGETLEVLGTCMTNTTPGSTHTATVEYRHLWSYAQQAALIAVSDRNPNTGCYELITDPERRAKRIAAHYADLYFKSGEKSKGKLNFHWTALAAFVVKDIVEAYRFSRVEVLHREWNDGASALRNNLGADIYSLRETGNLPYEHVLRTYSALAKGNLWLFMDIHPWLWFFLEFGLNADGTLNQKRLDSCLPERNFTTYQASSKKAVEELPFGPNWIARLADRLTGDTVYKKGGELFNATPTRISGSGSGNHASAAYAAHNYCRAHAKEYDAGYRMPPGNYWSKFQKAFYVMDAEHTELKGIIEDKASMNALLNVRKQVVTREITTAYLHLIEQYNAKGRESKFESKKLELAIIAKHEQLQVLQPLIYNDPKLKKTMDMNHKFSRWTSGWISPQFKVIYGFDTKTSDPALQTVFDVPTGLGDRFFGARKSLTDPKDRMEFVADIANGFNNLMFTRLPYMEVELQKIRAWMNA